MGRIDPDLIYFRDIMSIEGRDGDAEYTLRISVDVSDRRRAEELLVSAVDTLSGPFALWDADKRLVIQNETFQELNETIFDVIKPGETATVIF